MMSLLVLAATAVMLSSPAELPRVRVDASYPEARARRTLHVAAPDDFQRALELARPGDEITLEAGAVFMGPFTLPAKEGAGWIIVRSSESDALPRGRRVTPADAPRMPRLEARFGAVISAEPGSHHFRFVGIEMAPAKGAFLGNIVLLGGRESTSAEIPHHFVIDRCFIHGDPIRGSRRGIALGSAETAVIDSWISDFKEGSADSQAVAGWGGPGPYLIENNYLEAAGENLMFGGADPLIGGLVPSDIEILRNHLRKPLAWKSDDPSYLGIAWATKNLFQLKNARRVRVAHNLFEQNWVDRQRGFAILFTVRNQDGRAPWSVVEDVTFENNVVRRTAAGINILGRDDTSPSGLTARILIRHNLFDEVGGERWGGGGRLFQMLQGAADVVIEHNTAFQTGGIVTVEGAPSPRFVYSDNIAPHNVEGVAGTGLSPGRSVLAAFFPGGVFRRNVIVGGDAANYPPDNFFPDSLDDVGFVGRSDSDYRLAALSRFRRAARDGSDVGADFEQLRQALSAGTIPPSVDALEPGEAGFAERLPEALFWGAVFGLGYANVGYPLFLFAWSRVRPRPFRRGSHQPKVTVVIAAHNERALIGARLQNIYAVDYPKDRLDVVLGLDGCTDDTAARAREAAGPGVRVVEFDQRRGKPTVLNAVVPSVRGEIVVFADARQRFGRNALKALVAPFADPEVGAVSGELILTRGDGRPLGRGLGLYWRLEKLIRRSESEIGSVVGATGAIYAIRRELFEALPPDTILDDVLVPMRIARRGYRVVFEPRARAYDKAPGSLTREFARKVRTISGNFQLFARERWLLGPGNPLLIQTLSHKALRLLTPVLLALAALGNLLLLDRPFFQVVLLAQIAFYLVALFGHTLRNLPIPGLAVPYTICMLAGATTLAFCRHLGGRQSVTWAKEEGR